jgi:hypothetical protein
MATRDPQAETQIKWKLGHTRTKTLELRQALDQISLLIKYRTKRIDYTLIRPIYSLIMVL